MRIDPDRWEQQEDGSYRRRSGVPTAAVDATAGAAALAEKEGIDLADVEGTGTEGRVTKADVEAHAGQ